MQKNAWLIVANSSSARLFKVIKKDELEQIKVFEHPESRLHNLDLVSDKPGRDFESSGTRRHALEPKILPKQHEFDLFARELTLYLEQAFNKQEFETLYIAANPSLLGLIRKELSDQLTKVVKGEIDKDMTQMTKNEILQHLPFIL